MSIDPARGDLVAGRRQRFAWLVGERRFEEALELVRALAASSEAGDRQLGQELGRGDGPLAVALRRDLELRIEHRELAAAERAFALLGELVPPPAGPADAEPAGLASDDLPLALSGDRLLWRLDGAMAVLRVKGEGGGYRYERLGLVEVDPLELRAAVLASRSEPDRLLVALAALLRRQGRPVAAELVRHGRLSR